MNDPSLVRIVYASQIAAACLDDLSSVLDRILTASIRNNRLRGITGLLIAHQGWFVQALEGPGGATHALFNDICADSRHSKAVLLGERAVDAREFRQWNMCARQMSATDAKILDELDGRATFDPADLPERTVMRLLKTVALAHHKALTQQQSLAAA